ncbi:MAG: division/cell wall cluster transcriptional repressor MraZ [Rhodospirillales bacterium]|nr:division/cell wall cluster transcriptional repressor MraZ [Rhodospirillales bacterium]
MALFVGKHVNKIDKKGRVSVPKPFRATLQARGLSSLYIYPRFKQQALEACDQQFMNRLSRSLDDLDLFSEDQDDLASVILANTHELAFDPEGRIVLPADLVDYADIKGEVLFVGQGPRFQIWQPAAFEGFSAMAFERAKSRGATLKLAKSEDGVEDGA